MKTITSVLPEPTDTNKEKSAKEAKVGRCAHCGAKEGKSHPMRGFKVVLQPIDKEVTESPRVCLICRLDHLKKEALIVRHKTPLTKTLRQYLGRTLGILVILLILTGLILA